jgi:hypothetical protein
LDNASTPAQPSSRPISLQLINLANLVIHHVILALLLLQITVKHALVLMIIFMKVYAFNLDNARQLRFLLKTKIGFILRYVLIVMSPV